jgi:predicted N-acetyltransferase YhbS
LPTLPWRRPRGVPAIRRARDEETPRIADLLAHAGFGPTVAGLIGFPRRSPCGDILVAERDDRQVGAVCCASFGETGWVGALGVLPEARRRGAGQALTEAACDRLRERGARTILLFATEMGRPLYERMGFEAEGRATAWRGSAGVARAGVELRSVRESDRPALRELDRRATGERRDPVLDSLVPLSGMLAERAGEPVGWALASPWGAGVAICADDPEAGVALTAAAAGGPGSTIIVVPAANAAAAEALRRWSLQDTEAGKRMRLGPAVAWRPERQFGLFNLFWG